VSLYSLGAKYSIDGPWILAVKVLNWLGLGEKDAVAWRDRSDDRAAFFGENSTNLVASGINDGFTVAG
jgi:hypothetical protein